MKLTAGAIRRYPMIFAFMALATILGLKSYLELPRESHLVIRNGTLVPGDADLTDDDVVEIRPVISGGA